MQLKLKDEIMDTQTNFTSNFTGKDWGVNCSEFSKDNICSSNSISSDDENPFESIQDDIL